jgi:glutathione S-transferase
MPGASQMMSLTPTGRWAHPTLADVAVLCLVHRGMRLFTVRSWGKHPFIADWPRKATWDTGRSNAWMRKES